MPSKTLSTVLTKPKHYSTNLIHHEHFKQNANNKQDQPNAQIINTKS